VKKFGGDWSEEKLDCVEKYICSYLQVMQNQRQWKLHYVDAFAGRGRQDLKSPTAISDIEMFFGDESESADTQEFLVGSAIRALRASSNSIRQFDRFLFIEANPSSCRELQSLVRSDFPGIEHRVEVRCADANAALHDYATTVDRTSTRSFVFLDPYGLEVRWDLVQCLAETEVCDVWYLFPLGGVIRMMTNDGQIPDSWRDRLTRVFGTDDWHEAFYKSNPQRSLFACNSERLLKDASTQQVIDYVRKRLRTVFADVSTAGILRNRKGAPLFALLLGVSNPSPKARQAALRIANHLIKDLNQ